MNLQTTIDLDLKGFFQWWGQELAFLVPTKLRSAFSERSGRLVFTSTASGFDLVYTHPINDPTVTSTQSTCTLDWADSSRYQQFKANHPELAKAEYVLQLSDVQAIQQLIYLPLAAQENLQQVIRFELDRYTPFTVEQVYFTAVQVGKTDHDQLQVLLLLSPKVILDQQLQYLGDLGVNVQTVSYQATDRLFPQIAKQCNLLPERYIDKGNKLSQYLPWMVSGLLMSLMLLVLVLPVWQQSEHVSLLKEQLKTLEKQTRVIEAQQQQLATVRAETQSLIDIKQHSPQLFIVLSQLSQLLNDKTWLTHMQFSANHLQIQGQSPAASALIGILESSEFFNNVSFVSPLTQDKTTGLERFQISMEVNMPDLAINTPASTSELNSVEHPETAEPTHSEAEQ